MLITLKSDIRPPTAPVLGTPSAVSSSSLSVPLTTAATDLVAVASYSLERSTSAGGTYSVVSSAATFPYVDTGLSASTTYYYRAAATDTSGNVGAYSAIVSATTSSASAAADGAAYSFTSTASSTKSQTVSFLGGLNGYLNTGTDKAVANPPPANWVGPDNPTTGAGPGSQYPNITSNMPTASNAPVLTRKALGYYDRFGNAPNWAAFGYAYNHGAAIPEYFHHGYVYFGHTETTANLQWKVLRDSSTPVTIVDGSPQMRYFHWKGQDDFFVTTGPNGQFGGGVYFVGDTTSTFPNDLPAFNTGEWYRWEAWVRKSSGTNVADGASTIRMWRYSDGAQPVNFSFPNQTSYTTAARTQYVIMQNYFGNGSGLSENGGGFAYWCDPGVQAGAVGSAYRSIWLGDASTYAACNKGKLVYQPDSGSWSGTARSITALNKGHYASLSAQPLWLYERDNSGNAVNANGIALV